jgi:hypothetical protein
MNDSLALVASAISAVVAMLVVTLQSLLDRNARYQRNALSDWLL